LNRANDHITAAYSNILHLQPDHVSGKTKLLDKVTQLQCFFEILVYNKSNSEPWRTTHNSQHPNTWACALISARTTLQHPGLRPDFWWHLPTSDCFSRWSRCDQQLSEELWRQRFTQVVKLSDN